MEVDSLVSNDLLHKCTQGHLAPDDWSQGTAAELEAKCGGVSVVYSFQ